jgi:hypothetical protein
MEGSEIVVTVALPEKLARLIRERGVDVESFVIEAIEEGLKLDPREELPTRLEVAEYMLRRAEEKLGKDDAVQASEKLYNAVEECVKVLACVEKLEECRKAREKDGW